MRGGRGACKCRMAEGKDDVSRAVSVVVSERPNGCLERDRDGVSSWDNAGADWNGSVNLNGGLEGLHEPTCITGQQNVCYIYKRNRICAGYVSSSLMYKMCASSENVVVWLIWSSVVHFRLWCSWRTAWNCSCWLLGTTEAVVCGWHTLFTSWTCPEMLSPRQLK